MSTTSSTPSHSVLILGVGSIGERHLRCFLKTGRARVSFFEPRAELRDQIQARYPESLALKTWDETFQSDFDSVVIATPAPLHVSQALEHLQAGRHLLIEKPLSVTTEGVEELLQLSRRSDRVVAVAYVYRANPVLAEMRNALLTGEYGRPVELVSVCGQNFPTYRPAYRETYYRSHAQGGGAIQDALTHIINAGEWLVGPITKVVADAAHQVLEGVDVEDTVHVLARHGSIPASYSLNQHQAPNEITLSVICERGVLRYENHLLRWRVMTTPDTPWIDSPAVVLERDDWFIRQAGAFLDAVEGKISPLCSLEEGAVTGEINRAILRSTVSGCWEKPN